MTEVTNLYTAKAFPADIDIHRVGGTITLDTGQMPYADGRITVAITPELLSALDPRQGARVTVTASRDGGPARTFDLGVRGVRPDWVDATADVDLASDEAILSDIATLIQDRTPRQYEASARAIVAYVLSKIGATLAPGTVDADLTAQWPLDNLAIDPRCTTVTSWSFSGATATLTATTGISSVLGTGATTCATATLTASAASRVDMRKTTTVVPGRTYSFRGGFRFNFAGGASGLRGCTAQVLWMDKDGTPLGGASGPVVNITDAGSGAAPWTWLTISGVTAPVGATQAMWILRGSGSFPSGATVEASVWQPVEADDVVPYFDGYTANDDVYAYTWTEDANVSVSHREPTIERDPDALVWQPGQSAMDFLAPLLKANGIRLVCDETRTWTLRDDDYRHDGSSTWRWGVNLTELSDEITLDGDISGWFDAAVYTYRWTGRDGVERVRRDVFALNDPPRKVLAVDLDTPWPGPGRAEVMVRRAQDRGRVTSITGMPSWTEHADQAIQVTTQDGTVLAGTAGAVSYDLDEDTVTITSRTTRIPAGSISLLTGTIDALTGTIDNL